jgi:hypothetical protein
MTGAQQKTLIYNGEYTVPAYVINNVTGSKHEDTNRDESVTITMNDGSSFTYPAMNSDTEDEQFAFKDGHFKMEISSDFTYTFVGTLYKSIMPQYCYFLGWDSSAQKAAFWFNRVPDTRNYNWNNETGIICANWSLTHEITPADPGLFIPARWVASASKDLSATADIYCDDFGLKSNTQQSSSKGYMTMTFGNSMNVKLDDNNQEDVVSDDAGIPDAIQNYKASNKEAVWYNVNGQKLSRKPTINGVYIQNGNKYVVK